MRSSADAAYPGGYSDSPDRRFGGHGSGASQEGLQGGFESQGKIGARRRFGGPEFRQRRSTESAAGNWRCLLEENCRRPALCAKRSIGLEEYYPAGHLRQDQKLSRRHAEEVATRTKDSAAVGPRLLRRLAAAGAGTSYRPDRRASRSVRKPGL